MAILSMQDQNGLLQIADDVSRTSIMYFFSSAIWLGYKKVLSKSYTTRLGKSVNSSKEETFGI
jgi:hypothetical protein